MKNYKFGIIGCGAIANHHIKAMQHVKNGEFIAVFGVDAKQTEEFARINNLKMYNSLEEFLKNQEIDIVTICTPSGTHAVLAVKAMEAGKHVVVEKPLALNVEDCKAVVDAALKYDRKCEVICQLRFSKAIYQTKSAIESGALGKIVNASLHMKYWRDEDYYASSNWRGTWENDGGGALMNQGIHGVDLLLYFIGVPKNINAICSTLVHKIETEDTAAALLEWENGAIGVIEATTSVNPGYQRRIEICGSKGSIILAENNIEKWNVDFPCVKEATASDLVSGSSDPMAISYAGHAKQFEDIINAIEKDVPVSVGTKEGGLVVELICGIYESAKKRKQIEFVSQF